MQKMTEQNYALVSLYHPTGAKVSIPLSLAETITKGQASFLVESVDQLVAAGFTVNLPGLMDGENFEQIGFAVRREKVNDDGTVTPVMDVYPVNGNFRLIGMYLNSLENIKAFETATGLCVEKMLLWDGSTIERGKKPATDKYVTALKAPAKLVWKFNPKWEGDTDDKHPKRLFVRWEGLRPLNGNESAPEPVSMTVEEAGAVKTPGGAEIGTLSLDKLKTLSASTASNVTDQMREAAKIILSTKTA
jgi:hypothetical protein